MGKDVFISDCTETTSCFPSTTAKTSDDASVPTAGVCSNEAGPLVRVPPVSGEMTYRKPTRVVISEQSEGSVDGANRWAGFEEELQELTSDFWTNEHLALNTHRCDECEKVMPLAGRL